MKKMKRQEKYNTSHLKYITGQETKKVQRNLNKCLWCFEFLLTYISFNTFMAVFQV